LAVVFNRSGGFQPRMGTLAQIHPSNHLRTQSYEAGCRADALHELCASEKGREYFMPLQLVIGESAGPVLKDTDCR
jgi:hypothetical protein